MKRIFVTGIGTDIGKTLVSAILVEALKADYWKPVQAGDLHNTDTMKVKKLISNKQTVFHPEAYRLTQPMSPHAANDSTFDDCKPTMASTFAFPAILLHHQKMQKSLPFSIHLCVHDVKKEKFPFPSVKI